MHLMLIRPQQHIESFAARTPTCQGSVRPSAIQLVSPTDSHQPFNQSTDQPTDRPQLLDRRSTRREIATSLRTSQEGLAPSPAHY